ncbi:hypothetical protein C8R46DRAFT_592636 [Mycena filopes]|nr:hypothetical protein C8R46DRAFT_592636 [Mycena filopes]
MRYTSKLRHRQGAPSAPVCWSAIFDLLGATACHTLHDLTIEQHLDGIDLDIIPTTSSGTHTQHTHPSNRITFDIIRRLASLYRLRNPHRQHDLHPRSLRPRYRGARYMVAPPRASRPGLAPFFGMSSLVRQSASNAALSARLRVLGATTTHPRSSARSQRRAVAGPLRRVERVVESDLLVVRPASRCCRTCRLSSWTLPSPSRGGRD